MIKNINGKIFFRIFCIAWAFYYFIDYILHSQYLTKAFSNFQYTGFLIFLFAVAILVTFLISKRKGKTFNVDVKNFRGIYHYLFLLCTMFLIMLFYLFKSKISADTVTGAFTFLFRTIWLHSQVFLIFLVAMSTGNFFVRRLQLPLNSTAMALVTTATGLMIIGTALFLLAAAGVYQFWFILILFTALLVFNSKNTLKLVREISLNKSDSFQLHYLSVAGYVLVVFLAAVALTFDTRPIPLGYDALGLYMNVPKLLAGYQSLPHGGDAYNWSLIMGLGFSLFANPNVAILLSVFPGILAVFAIYELSRQHGLSRNWAVYAAVIYFSLPNTIWQLKNDEKTDFAMLFITLCSFLIFFNAHKQHIQSKTDSSDKKSSVSLKAKWWILAGLLLGFSFGIKYVALLSVFAIIVMIFYSQAGILAAAGMFFINLAVIFLLDLPRMAAFSKDHFIARFAVPLIAGIGFFIYAFLKNKSNALSAVKISTIVVISFAIPFLPWAIKNNLEHGTFSADHTLSGKTPLPELYEAENKEHAGSTSSLPVSHKVLFAGVGISDLQNQKRSLTKQETDVSSPSAPAVRSSINNEKVEEIRRYIGYEPGVISFLTLPYDLPMKINVNLPSSDTGILFLMLLPALLIIFAPKSLFWNLLKVFLLVVFAICWRLSASSTFNNSSQSIITDDSGNIVTRIFSSINDGVEKCSILFKDIYQWLTIQETGISFIILTMLVIPAFFIFRKSFRNLNVPAKIMAILVFTILFYWLILSSGIVWYGIVGFSLTGIIIAAYLDKNEDKFLPRFVLACSVAWIILILPFQLTPTKVLYETDENKINYTEFIDPIMARYAIGEINSGDVMKQFFSPAQANILKIINRDKNARILNVSTFLNYFIDNNDTRVFKDNQLGIFKLLYMRAKNDKNKLAEEFRKNKIKYILVNLKTASIDNTPDKSLTKKFDRLMRALVNNNEVRLVYTNRIVERPDGDLEMGQNGIVVKAKYDIVGKRVLDPGTDALFEVL